MCRRELPLEAVGGLVDAAGCFLEVGEWLEAGVGTSPPEAGGHSANCKLVVIS